MSIIKRRKNPAAERRSHVVDSSKTSAYHYSARRLDSQKTADRQAPTFDRSKDTQKTRPLIGVGVAILLVGLFFLLSTLSATPSVSQTNAQSMQNVDAYKKSVTDTLAGSVLNRSKLTLDREKIVANLQQIDPSITSVNVKTPMLSRNVHITVQSAEPALRLLSGEKTYILSAEGRVIGDDKISAVSELPVVKDKSSVQISIGKPALTSQQVGYIKEVITQSNSRGLQISSMELTAGGGELDVRYKDVPYFVKFNFFEDARKCSGTFFAVKDRVDIENSQPKEYIDVRVAERAYVK